MFLASSTFQNYSQTQPYVDKCEYFIRPSTNQTIRLLVRFINTWYKECMLELWFVFHNPNKKMKLQYWDCSMTRTTKVIPEDLESANFSDFNSDFNEKYLDYLIAFLKRNKYKLLAVAYLAIFFSVLFPLRLTTKKICCKFHHWIRHLNQWIIIENHYGCSIENLEL